MPEEIGLGFKYSKMPDGRPLIILDGDTFGAFVAMLENGTFSAVLGSAHRFDPMKNTVGDLIGLKIGASPNPVQSAKGVGDLVGQPLGAYAFAPPSAYQPPKVSAQASGDPSLVFSSFDPMRPTVGDLVGSETVDVAASAPVVRRTDGSFDPLQPTVGDLVTTTLPGHTSKEGPPAGRRNYERPRSPFLTI